jgi:signal transduction histidine kinase
MSCWRNIYNRLLKMSKQLTSDSLAPQIRLRKRFIGWLSRSRLVAGVAGFPLIAWAIPHLVRILVRRHIGEAGLRPDEVVAVAQTVTGGSLEHNLEGIARDVVNAFGYVGAMVATYEADDSLPVRAFYVDPGLVMQEQIDEWEAAFPDYQGKPVRMSDPDVVRAYVNDEAFQNNLSVRAVKARQPVLSDDLHDLFTPVAPDTPQVRSMVRGIQEALGIKQVIAVPFFLEECSNGQPTSKVVGNLFAAKSGPISPQDVRILSALGRQAAVAIESEQRRRRLHLVQQLVFAMQINLKKEYRVLEWIAEGVVSKLGYVGAMVATYEADDSLPVRAFYVDPGVATSEQIEAWEAAFPDYQGKPVRMSDPDVVRAYVNDEAFQNNLSVRAVKAGQPVLSDDLHDLFTPVAPDTPQVRSTVRGIQEALGIKQVIAVPFFLEGFSNGQTTSKVVGNLFAASRSKFSPAEIELLQAFGRQAAAGIHNATLYRRIEELYRQSEERREAAQIFAKMAFSASASVHALRGHIGVVRGQAQFLHMLDQFPPEKRQEILAESPMTMLTRLDQAANILDTLHEPWRDSPDVSVDINTCVLRALDKIVPQLGQPNGLVVHKSLTEQPLPFQASPEMLTEACKVILKNAVEAIQEKGDGGDIWVETSLQPGSLAEISIRDSGIGIKAADLDDIFEMRWSTKSAGMGFGLFWTRDYVEGLGGHIEVDSSSSQGTTFRIRLPVA